MQVNISHRKMKIPADLDRSGGFAKITEVFPIAAVQSVTSRRTPNMSRRLREGDVTFLSK